MKALMAKCAAIFLLILCLPGLAAADPTSRCTANILKGTYVFTASGFTRASGSLPGNSLGSQGDPRSPSVQRRRHAQHASGHRRKPVRRLRRHTSRRGRPWRVFDQRRLHRHRALFRRQQCNVQHLRRPSPGRHGVDDPDQPSQQRVPGQRQARVVSARIKRASGCEIGLRG